MQPDVEGADHYRPPGASGAAEPRRRPEGRVNGLYALEWREYVSRPLEYVPQFLDGAYTS